ncbi:mechanosensitive ion channel family protein [Altererythrobacter sp. KTW20L]|uniref:mechanosensitive ion channel family protein n=1 Tax=Altererythrobacter sp. KTW20L TaxID=2942210 RepID=UPI0020BED197|nr:mechanosensitive ion channel family protein [Altererythrobacter sp. KTW20L]MCL6249786.1 mechanosensitive ion channel family protein [Altererythrobacter sp. KTW20L]
MLNELATNFAEQALWVQSLIGLALLLLLALAVNWLLKHVILRFAAPFLDTRTRTADRAAARLATVFPLLIVSRGIEFVPHLPEEAIALIANLARASIVLSIAMAISKGLDYVEELYRRRPEANSRPIKGYVQVVKILVYCTAVILIISVLIDQSPLLLLSGLGAMAAVLMLVFKDTILSLVASVQLSSNDMLRVGDWIEMPGMNADGDVIDIALHTVKVQNFDKTITTIPTHMLIANSFRNWRGMSEAGGRRIMRALPLDQNSVRFLTDEEAKDLCRFRLLEDYLGKKEAELREWNARELEGERNPVNARRITNIGTFRAYISAYLKAHPRLATDSFTLLVRQLDPTPEGLPLQIYCFTNTTSWAEYEGIQADIFDHLIAILPEFHLRLFQQPSGLDLAHGLGQRVVEGLTGGKAVQP